VRGPAKIISLVIHIPNGGKKKIEESEMLKW
jgi:hypothetical protein